MTKAELKYLQSLHKPKYRYADKVYVVEGDKCAEEWIADKRYIQKIFCTEEWATKYDVALKNVKEKIVISSTFDIEKASALNTPTSVIVLVAMPKEVEWIYNPNQWYLALDAVRDPGNMGTIIRIADWFGIKDIILSDDCVDVYNPKVVQASMGSILRVNIHWSKNLAETLKSSQLPIYITHLEGNPISKNTAYQKGVIVMGNESKGVHDKVSNVGTDLLLIPRIGSAESLNVAVATGIICSSLIL
jgi:TrmH family RNA methyltransferase